MRLRGLLVARRCGALVLVPAATSAPRIPSSIGTVGPGFTIALAHPDGAPVTQLDPGTYEIVVRDLSDFAQLPPLGPGRERAPTSVDETGT